MSDQDKTPTDGKTTLELVFGGIGALSVRLDDLSADSKLAVKEAREANRMSSDNNRMLKALTARTQTAGLLHASAPYAALLLAIFAIIRAW
jgi:hypothetical protein